MNTLIFAMLPLAAVEAEADAMGIPPSVVCEAFHKTAASNCNTLRNRQWLFLPGHFRHEEYERAWEDNEYMRRLWWACAWARWQHATPSTRRYWLARVRDIQAERFATGREPPLLCPPQ